jgi:hypothetical protein
MQQDKPPLEDRIEDSDLSAEYARPPTGESANGADISVALPAQYGDKLTVHYPDECDEPHRGNPEEWLYGGLRGESVVLVAWDAYQDSLDRADDDEFVTLFGKTCEGVFRFNNRIRRVAETVCVERIDSPEYLSIR